MAKEICQSNGDTRNMWDKVQAVLDKHNKMIDHSRTRKNSIFQEKTEIASEGFGPSSPKR